MTRFYYTSEEERILNIVTKAIKKLNKSKSLTIKLDKINFGLGVDDNKPDELTTTVTITILNNKTKLTDSLFYHASFFDASITNKDDIAAGVTRVKDEQNKLILRMAYNIWRYCRVQSR